ncbi:MAG: DUF1858 domain-containing protein, partial [Spirochaetota bacterium]
MTINRNTTLLDITEQYPDTVERLVEIGFRRMGDPAMRARFASSVTVEAAALARGMEPADLLRRLGLPNEPLEAPADEAPADEAPADESRDASSRVATTGRTSRPIEIAGLVPCPIRVPMTNVLESAIVDFTAETGLDVEYDLKAAYMGTEWMEENLGDNPDLDDLPD